MRKIVNPFVLALSTLLGLGYLYLALRIPTSGFGRLALALPFLSIWVVPVVYWVRGKQTHSHWDDLVHGLAYVSMGWLNFLLILTVFRDLLLITVAWALPEGWRGSFLQPGSNIVLGASFLVLGLGLLEALRGPRLVAIDVPIEELDASLEGLRIVQISDLHASSMIRRTYVQRVVDMANELAGDLIVLTGDLVDGSVERLQSTVAPLASLRPLPHRYLILGNHEYYSGVRQWTEHFRSLGLKVLLNECSTIEHKGATIHVGGVVDPAAQSMLGSEGPRPDLAVGPADKHPGQRTLRLLLAHNPKLASQAAPYDFDLMLSGHTHAGQFFPWNLAVRIVHAPHVVGLSREGRMWVYVNAGTGSWGPPIRFGTKPELTLIRLVRAVS